MKTSIDPGMIDRLHANTKYLFRSYNWLKEDSTFDTPFMGPDRPQPKSILDIDPRYYDYEVGENLKLEPHPGREGVTHQQLRALSEACELVRGVLENKKNQVNVFKSDFQLKETTGKTPQQVKEETERSKSIRRARALFNKPDGEHTFRGWIRMMIEEIYVLDHLCILPVKNLNGNPFRFKLIDGSTIIKRIDKNGDRPAAPSIAYQQKIKGVITHDFTTKDLFVYHRNPRVNKVYGFGPLEQMVGIVNIALRRTAFQTSYYTEGNIPDMLLRVSAQWDDAKIAKFQKYFDLLLRGDLKARRRVRFIPEAAEPIYPQKDVLKDEFDEWLARLITYFFGSSPNQFIRNLNRSVSEQQREQSDEEGLFSILETIKEVIDMLLVEYLGLTDIEFVWIPNRAQDSLKQAQIDQIDVETGIRSIDEVRDTKGLPPIGLGNMVRTAHGYVALPIGGENKLEPIAEKTPEEIAGQKSTTNKESETEKE